MKNVLIMGGSYFIGKHVVNTLKHDYKVYILNRGTHPFNDKQVHELICDRNDALKLKEVLSPYRFDYVVDISGITQAQSDNLINALDLSTIKKFIYISSSAVYHINKAKAPFKEGDPLGGDSPFKAYADHKREAEMHLKNRLSKNIFIALRPPFVYGENNYVLRERLMFKLIEEAQPIYVPSSNNQVHFVYVRDLALHVKEAIEDIIPPGIYNVGDSQALSFEAWVNACAKVVKKSANILFINPDDYALKATDFFPFFDYDNVLSVSKIKQYSKTETPFSKGLENAYKDYQLIRETVLLKKSMENARDTIKNNAVLKR